MSAPEFLDTNILVYAYDATDSRKQDIARSMLVRALRGEILASTQVMAEFAATLLHKLSPAVPPKDVCAILDVLAPIKLIAPDGETVRRAVQAHAAYGVHFYDGMIIASAERAGCERIWSEDLSPSQKYFGITVADPFR